MFSFFSYDQVSGVCGREVVGQPHMITLKTRTVKWYILTIIERIFWNFRDNFDNKVEGAI